MIIKFYNATNTKIKVGDKVIFDFEPSPTKVRGGPRIFEDIIFKVLTTDGEPIASLYAYETHFHSSHGERPVAYQCKQICNSTNYFISSIIGFDENKEFVIVVRSTRQLNFVEPEIMPNLALVFNSGLFSYYRISGKRSSECDNLVLKGFRNSKTKQEFLNFHEKKIRTLWQKFLGDGSAYRVDGIAPRAFKNNEYLKEVDAEFDYVGQECFSGCSNLESVKISARYCYSQSFKNCFNLKKVSGDISFVSKEVFKNCHNLESVSIICDYISKEVFKNCHNLESVSIICDYISDEVFMNCSKLQNVELRHTFNFLDVVTGPKIEYFSWIGKSSFEGCIGLTTIDLRSSSITIISKRAFANCQNLKTILLPETVNSVDEEAFLNCESLEEIHFPNGMFQIKENAFANCVNLHTVSFGRDIVHISKDAFKNCKSLTKVQKVHVFGRCHKNEDETFEKCLKK